MLAEIRPGLEACGFKVEQDETAEGKIRVRVLVGKNGTLEVTSMRTPSVNAERRHRAQRRGWSTFFEAPLPTVP